MYGFAQQSGGRVSIASELGIGTVVTLLLPKSSQAPVSAQKTVEPPVAPSAVWGSARGGEVLLVEDDKEVAALTREMLGALGFSVNQVSTPTAALDALANAPAIDAVLSDIMMPGGTSGLDLAREIETSLSESGDCSGNRLRRIRRQIGGRRILPAAKAV